MNKRLDKLLGEEATADVIELYMKGWSLRRCAFIANNKYGEKIGKRITTRAIRWLLKTKNIPTRSKKEQWIMFRHMKSNNPLMNYYAPYVERYGNIDWY